MCTLVKLGLIFVVYGVLMHSQHSLFCVLFSNLVLLAGSVLFICGDKVEALLSKYLPNIKW